MPAANQQPQQQQQPQKPADTVLLGGEIYTMDGARSWAQAIAIRAGRIVYVGTDAGARPFIGAATEVSELGGKMVLPGFHDSHVHPLTGGVELAQCNLNGLTSHEAVIAAIRECVAAGPGAPWLNGGGWDLPLFANGNPSRFELDRLVPDRLAYLESADGHNAWVNSAALRLAGITAATADPPRGRIERDPATGEPSGTLREAAADLVSALLPPVTAADRLDGLRRGLAMAARYGITSLVEASADADVLAAYRDLERRGELTARVVVSQHWDPERGGRQSATQVAELVRARDERASDLLRATAVKIFADGVIEGGTAALLEPYLGRPDDRGILELEPAELERTVVRLDRAGFQIHVHAIGDRAIRLTLDALAAAELANGRRDARHHLAHVQLIDPADIPRFRRLRAIANFQHLWSYADSYITDLTEPVLGPQRSRWLYPVASVVRSGGMIVGGSDWSVSSMNPLEAIEVAVTRRAPGAPPGPAWNPEERIDLATALAAYTTNGAYLAFDEKLTGSLEVGKAADLIVLDRNLFELAPEEIHGARVLLTLLNGKETYRAEELPRPADRRRGHSCARLPCPEEPTKKDAG